MRNRYIRRALMVGVAGVVLLQVLPARAFTFGFRAADFTILSAKADHVIGTAHFTVDDRRPGVEVVNSTAQYLDGQYDQERDVFDVSKATALPQMTDYLHKFFHADHSPFLESKVDFRTGDAICIIYGAAPVVLHKTIPLSSNLYAGAATMLPLQKALRDGDHGPILMHVFACMPGPRVLKVEAYTQPSTSWSLYPGKLVRASIRPDFGWLDYLIAPFIPQMHAWFSPGEDFHFVGAEFARFYKGPEVILARTDNAAAQAASESPRSTATRKDP